MFLDGKTIYQMSIIPKLSLTTTLKHPSIYHNLIKDVLKITE